MNRQTWTTKQWIHLSNSVAGAFGGGLNSGASEVASDGKGDSWTTEKFVNMSRSLARAFYADF